MRIILLSLVFILLNSHFLLSNIEFQRETQKNNINVFSRLVFIETEVSSPTDLVLLIKRVEEINPGGVVLKTFKPELLTDIINCLKDCSVAPLLIGFDAGNIFFNPKHPKIICPFDALKAITQNELILQLGGSIASYASKNNFDFVYFSKKDQYNRKSVIDLLIKGAEKNQIPIVLETNNKRNRIDSSCNYCIAKSENKDIFSFYLKDIENFNNNTPDFLIKNNKSFDKKHIENQTKKLLSYINVNYKKEKQRRKSEFGAANFELTKQKIAEASIILAKNSDDLIPLKNLDRLSIMSVEFGVGNKFIFQDYLKRYTNIKCLNMPCFCSGKSISGCVDKIKGYDLIILSVQDFQKCEFHEISNTKPTAKYSFHTQLNQIIDSISDKTKIITVLSLPFDEKAYAKVIEKSDVVIFTFPNHDNYQKFSAQLIFGGIGAIAKMPYNFAGFEKGSGLTSKALRFKYTLPEDAGIDSKKLNSIDSVVKRGLDEKAFPGCQVLIARNRKVIFHKTYGYHTFEKINKVKKDDIYDFASVTKITGPLPALMKMYEDGKIDIDKPFSNYWPDWKNRLFHKSNKADLIFRDILAHQAGLFPWIPFWKMTKDDKGKYIRKYFRPDSSDDFSLRVADNLYLSNKFKNKIYKSIRKSNVKPEKKYVYSGLSFFLYPQIIENITGKNYEAYLKETFYKPLGAKTLTFNPYKHFSTQRIIPTEYDAFFRKTQIRGYVHDEGAATMGGLSGNAGLFGSANDLAKLMQMYLQMGEYGGKRYLKTETLTEFSKCQFPDNNNRRGLGFDKPLLENNQKKLKDAYPAPSSSMKSFGHSGFTGTFTWVDPESGILFIFFSNRVFPTRDNRKLYSLNIRPSIHQAVYNAIIE